MNKAEERSEEIIRAALDYANNLDDVKPTDDFSRKLCIALGQTFMKGAEWEDEHQAEKDLELTWEDMVLFRMLFDATDADISLGSIKIQPMTKEYYQEVLKRFREMKEK